MAADKLSRFWLLATFLLVLIILIYSVIFWIKSNNGQPLVISAPPVSDQFKGQIYVAGAVGKPGIYTLQTGDTVESLIQSSGGVEQNADISRLQLYIPPIEENRLSQKVDINRAEIWLLQALPGIGEVRAQAIVDYRQQNGNFQSIEELTQVPGINNSVFEKIQGLISIGEQE